MEEQILDSIFQVLEKGGRGGKGGRGEEITQGGY